MFAITLFCNNCAILQKDKNISNTKTIKIAEECEKYTKNKKEY